MAVTEAEIRKCIKAGACTVEQVSAACGASTGCGGCHETVELLVEGGSILHRSPPHPDDSPLPRSA
jgi:bacterioferritin-associated ferredoxin